MCGKDRFLFAINTVNLKSGVIGEHNELLNFFFESRFVIGQIGASVTLHVEKSHR